MIPPRFGTSNEFACCRQLLQDVGYTEETLRARFGLKALSDIASRKRSGASIDDPLELLTQLFVDGRYAYRGQIDALLPCGSLEVLSALRLVTPAAHNDELWAATVMLYPRANLFLASDRPVGPDGIALDHGNDIVFSALTDNTERFLELLPGEPCDRFLDLGTGTGIAALVAASWSQYVWATDLTARSVRFADFNRRLNGLSNVTVLRGDLYEPVEELTFNRIVIHPPYVPALHRAVIYQDGGLDGQEITRRAVAGLPKRLAPGGCFYSLTLGADCDGLPFERAVRQWLHPSDDDFDIVFLARNTVSPEFMARSVAIKSGGVGAAARLEQAFRQLRIREFVYGTIMIRRHGGSRQSFTVRRQRAAGSGRASIDWLLRWETELASRGSEWLLDARLRASPDVELLVTHRMVASELSPAAYRLQTEHPFSVEAKAAPWMGLLVARCDGVLTGHAHYQFLRDQEAIPADVGPTAFARVLGQLISGGFIAVPEFEPPPSQHPCEK